MAVFTLFSNSLKKFKLRNNVSCANITNNFRLLGYVSKEYNENNDPATHFFDKKVQQLLFDLTRIDLKKIFHKRKIGKLKDPTYEFLTDHQLNEHLHEIRIKAIGLLQFPPAVVVRKPKVKVFSRDFALKGYGTSKFVFTDITFGLKDNERLIVTRDLDGTLQEVDWTSRDRINQVFFPRKYRQLKVPHLFKENYFEELLNRREYVFILDLACQQFEPADPEYQRVSSITYQHINNNNEFEKIRGTRHFGSMTFF
ncbi:hypothetical protein HHI36_004853 [Cryptolaemus montrouzieri]|uniref:Uncharacterized protein n=1 Tax=Cryptolaemus montrouzieri TaxID=559131 RepID=A0ABD2NSD8_9CUCU